jgi:hypothetical protein
VLIHGDISYVDTASTTARLLVRRRRVACSSIGKWE